MQRVVCVCFLLLLSLLFLLRWRPWWQLHMHSLSGCISPTHSLSHSPTLSRDFSMISVLHQVALHFWATLAAQLTINRERGERAASLILRYALKFFLSLSPVLLSRPRGRKTSFLITPRTTSFSSTPASSVAWLKGCCCRSTLYSLLSALHSPLAVLLFSFRWGLFGPTTQCDSLSQHGGKYLRGIREEEEEQERVGGLRCEERKKDESSSWECAQAECVTSSRFVLSHNVATALNSFIRIWNIQELLKPQPARRGTQFAVCRETIHSTRLVQLEWRTPYFPIRAAPRIALGLRQDTTGRGR